MPNNTELLFTCLFAIHISSLVKRNYLGFNLFGSKRASAFALPSRFRASWGQGQVPCTTVNSLLTVWACVSLLSRRVYSVKEKLSFQKGTWHLFYRHTLVKLFFWISHLPGPGDTVVIKPDEVFSSWSLLPSGGDKAESSNPLLMICLSC